LDVSWIWDSFGVCFSIGEHVVDDGDCLFVVEEELLQAAAFVAGWGYQAGSPIPMDGGGGDLKMLGNEFDGDESRGLLLRLYDGHGLKPSIK
jgi:hypothetical protein